MKRKLTKIKKADWVVVRLLVEMGRLNPQQINRSKEVVMSLMYLMSKYGVNKVCEAIDLIKSEKE